MVLFAATLLLFQIDLQRPVTILIRPTTVRAALVAVSTKTGVPLNVQPKLAAEIVEADVHAMPLRTLLEKLAFVLHATVAEDGKGFTITRPVAMQNKLEQAEIDKRASSFQKLLDKKKLQLDKVPTPAARAEEIIQALKKQDDYVREQQANGKPASLNLDVVRQAGPAGRLLNELMALIGAHVVASVPNFKTIYYSNRPVAGQIQFPAEASKLIADYAETERLLATFLVDGKASGPMVSEFADIFKAATSPEEAGKVILTINRVNGLEAFGVNVFSRSGKMRTYAYSNNYDLGSENIYQAAAKLKSGPPVLEPLSSLEQELYKLAPDDPNIARLPGQLKPLTLKMSPALKSFVSQPEDHEPLELMGGRTLRSVARNKRLDLVACLPDGLAWAVRPALKGDRIDLVRFEEGTKALTGMECSTAEGVYLTRPASPISTEENRLPRVALGNYVRSRLAEGRETLASVARFSYEGGFQVNTSLPRRTYDVLLVKQGITEIARQHRFEFYALLGCLGSKWMGVNNGGGVPAGSLGTEERVRLLDWIHSQELEGDRATGLSDLMRSPIEAFQGEVPNGILSPANDLVAGIRSATSPFEGWPNHFRDAPDLAQQYAYWTLNNNWQFSEDTLDKSEYVLGSIRRTGLIFQIAPGLFVKEQQNEDDEIPDSKPMKYSALPEDFRREIRDLYDKARKRGD